MALDPDKIRFRGKLISAAIALDGSIDSKDSEALVETLFSEWKASGVPLSGVAAWLAQRLVGVFAYEDKPPRWIEEEPSWPFFEGMPMIFISQHSLSAESKVSPDTEVYLFAAKVPYANGFKVTYRIVEQFSVFRAR